MPHFIKTGFWALEQKGYKGWLNLEDIMGGGGGASVITVTYTALQSLITGNQLVPGSIYKITGFNKNMPDGSPENPIGALPVVLYDDGTNSGITIYLQAVTNNTLAESGHGEFYNPKYFYQYEGGPFNPLTVDQRPYGTFYNSLNSKVGQNILGDFLIMHSLDSGNYYLINFTQWTQGGGGGFSYTRQLITPTMDEPIISFTKTNGGSEVDIIEAGVLEITRGNNQGIYNAAIEGGWNSSISPEGTEWSRNGMLLYDQTDGTGLYGIWDGDNPDVDDQPTYQVNQVVFWGGYAWRNLLGNTGSAENVLTLNSDDWQKLPYSNTTYYEKVIDEIKVDLNNGILIGRTNIENQITVEFNADQYWWFMVLYSDVQSNPIAVMGWGLYSKITPEGLENNFYGISNVKVINSVCETVNFKGIEFLNVEMESSYFNSNYIGKNSSIYSNLLDRARIDQNILTNSGSISSNTLTNGYCSITNNVINNGGILRNTIIGDEFFLGDSSISQNQLNESCYIGGNELSNGGRISNNTFTDSSNIISNNTVSNGSAIESNTLDSGSNIVSNTLTTSRMTVGLLSGRTIQKARLSNTELTEDLSTATAIFLNTEKKIFTRLDGTKRLSYYNTTDTPTIVDVDA